jgi:uncharacterized membrane protein
MNKNINVEKLILTGLMTALVTVTTIVIPIPVPFTNGYVHPGDSMVFMSVLLLGRGRGALAAGVGSAFADVVLGFFIWAPFTFVIKGAMAFIAGLIIEKCAQKPRNIVISCVFTVGLWVLFEAALKNIAWYSLNANATAYMIDPEAGMAGDAAGASDSINVFAEARVMWLVLLVPVVLILIAVVLRKKEHIVVPPAHIVGMTGGGAFMVFGYYVAGGLIYGNFITAALSIPANIAQFAVGFLLAALLSAALRNTSAKRYLIYGAKKAEADKGL